jgi:DNA-binding SARP family transcriptional activator
MEMLMELFWPDTEPQYARKSLHQAIYTLRKSFQLDTDDFAVVLYDEGCYYLNPAAVVWIDHEMFSSCYKSAQQLEHRGQLDEAVEQYQVAVSLYEGEFLAEDRYEEWPLLQRERLKHNYLDLLDHLSEYYFSHNELAMAITLCRRLLDADPCREDSHRRLMRAFLRRGQRHLALRQYHLCVQALHDELGVPPMPATIDLFQQIQNK